MGGKGLEGKSRALVKLVFIERGMETDAEFWLGLIDVGGPQSNGSPFARMLETIDINSEDSEVKLLNWSVELEARAVLDREERRQLHIYTYIFCENFQSWYLPTSCYAYIRTQFVRIIDLATIVNESKILFEFFDFQCYYKLARFKKTSVAKLR